MADDNLYEVWGDTVDSRHLLAAIAIGAACSLGTFFLAEHLLTGWVESSQMARAYAMLLGILGSLLGGGVSACLFKPKRHVVEHVADPAWRQQVLEELRSEYGGIGQLGNIHELFEQFKQIEAVIFAAVLEVCFKLAAADVVFQLSEIVYRKHSESFLSAEMQRWVRSCTICSTCAISARVMLS